MPKRAGFTLVELLIVISIIAILTVIGLATYAGVQKNARDARRKDDLRAIKLALELYYQRNGQYPVPATEWIYSNSPPPWIPNLVPNYIANLSADPLKNNGDPRTVNKFGYGYYSNNTTCGNFSGGQFFALFTKLENTSDNQRNKIQQYIWCDGSNLAREGSGWSDDNYVITSER